MKQVVYKDFVGTVTEGSIPLHQFTSSRSGLKVAIAEIEGPIVNVNIAIATEASDHDGCPHVLEHLIFLGSEEFPFKGVLDKLANRSFAQGTNAYTDVDHTCYQLTTAGEEGFLRILPVFLDHVLFPTITDEGFYTEVHHINGENGEDAGVVYCEMQGSENTSNSLTHERTMEMLFSGSGYEFNTGGRVKNLRDLTVEKVREYHKQFYRPDNVIVIITGPVNAEKTIDALQTVEEKINTRKNTTPHPQPFTKLAPQLTTSEEKSIQFPSDDEEGGALVSIGWRACEWKNHFDRMALFVLWNYLAESNSAPLYRDFVDLEDPLCAEIYFNIMDMAEIAQVVEFDDVPTEKVDLIKDTFFNAINRICNDIDMERMQTMIKRRIVKHFNAIENSPHGEYSTALIANFLYGRNANDLEESLNPTGTLELLQQQDAQFWSSLIKKYLLDTPHVCVKSNPSEEMGEKLEKAEKDRIKKRKKELGPTRMKALIEDLKKAEAKNAIAIPDELLSNFSVPDVNQVHFFDTTTSRNDLRHEQRESNSKLTKYVNFEQYQVPFFIQFDHIETEFVKIDCTLNTAGLSDRDRLFLPFFTEAMFKLPIQKGETLIKYKQVLRLLDEETIDYGNGVGLYNAGKFSVGDYSQFLTVGLKVERSKYARSIELLSDFLWNTLFTVKRLKVVIQNLITSIASTKRDPEYIGDQALKAVNFGNATSHLSSTSFMQEAFLNDISAQLDKNPEKVIEELERVRQVLAQPQYMRIHVIANVYKLEQPMKQWAESFLPNSVNREQTVVPSVHARQQLHARATETDSEKQAAAFGIKSTESGYLFSSAIGLSGYDDNDHAALAVAIEYLTGFEGPFWISIRGKGLSYNYNMSSNRGEGLLYFELAESGDVVKAYAEAKRIVQEYLEGKVEFNHVTLEAARSSVIYRIISLEETKSMAAAMQFIYTLQGVSERYHQKELLDKIAKVTKEDVRNVLAKYISRLFEAKHSNAILCTSSAKVKDTAEQFKQVSNRDVSVQQGDLGAFFKKQ